MSNEPTPHSETVLVSACLLGARCRYDGRDNRDGQLERELARRELRALPFCPEERGGLSTPRPPAWLTEGDAAAVLRGEARVRTEDGSDVSAEFKAGAEAALAACREHGIQEAWLKERSPSCGVCQTHRDDQLVAGPGVTAALLSAQGVRVRGIEGRRE